MIVGSQKNKEKNEQAGKEREGNVESVGRNSDSVLAHYHSGLINLGNGKTKGEKLWKTLGKKMQETG